MKNEKCKMKRGAAKTRRGLLRNFSFFLFHFAFAAGVATAAPTAISIRFLDAATVEGSKIRLGDVARIMAGGERAVAQLETLEVAKAAAFGLTRSLDTETLFARYLQPLSDRYLIDYDRKCVRVTTRAAVLPADSLSALIDAFLATQPKRPKEAWHWELVRAPQDILVPTTRHTLEISFAGLKHKGKVDLNLAIKDAPHSDVAGPGAGRADAGTALQARPLRILPVTINLRVEEPVLVARRAIARDSALDQSAVSLELRETTQFNEIALGDPGKLMGRLAKVSIAQGRIITPRLVAVPPAVRRGQEAKITFRNGGVSITADAVCRQDGVPGQVITAVSLVTHRLMRVRVTEAGALEPVPGG
jgi:flagella basal body P-ring formation protein FlgA